MRNRLLGVLTAGALLGLAGCASNKAAPAATTTAKTEQGVSEVEQKVAAQATGAQEGKLKTLESGELVLDPYDPAAGEATLAYEAKTPVFQGDQQISLSPEDALKDGDDVKVYYQARGEEAPLVLGVAKLDEEQAKELMSAYGATEQPAEERFAEADGMQEGKVAKITDDELVLRPYEPQAGEAELAISEDTTVVRDGVEVGREAIGEGSDVRVFFDLKDGEMPEVVGVEILPEDQAKELQEEQSKE